MQTSANHPDNLDPRFQKFFWEKYKEEPDMVAEVYGAIPHNGRADMRFSQAGTLPNFTQWTGTVNYQQVAQGYNSTATYVVFAQGFQVERELMDDDQYHIFDREPKAMGRAAFRTRQEHGARMFNMGFGTDSFFYDNTENRALFSDDHLTTSGASTANGFDNLTTASLTATGLAAARIQARDIRGDRAERISVNLDTILIPPNLYEVGYEIIKSSGKVDVATNNRNVHEGAYKLVEWQYLQDANNWFAYDSSMMKEYVNWIDRDKLEFAMVEDFDTFTGKWRGRMRYANVWTDWRFGIGANVS